MVRALLVLACVALALFAWRVRDVLLLVFGAVLLATVLRALADTISQWTPIGGRWAFMVSVGAVLGLVVLAGWLFGAEIHSQTDQLLEALPRAWQQLENQLRGAAWFSALQDRLSGAAGGVHNLIAGARWAATSLLAIIANLLLIAFGAIYIAAQPDLYRRGVLALVPPDARGRAGEALQTCSGALRLWLLGQLASMLIVGTLTGLGLWLVGLQSALALGVLAGLAEFVPILGPIAAALPALVLAVPEGAQMVLWVLAVYVGVQQIESYLLMPMIQRKAVLLPPALTLFAVVAMGTAFGPLGLLFATPFTVVVYVLVKKLYIRETLHQSTDIPGTTGNR
jgi:predicted PurR-regulated permease PerM